jgi:flagellar basal body rod protein FlgG
MSRWIETIFVCTVISCLAGCQTAPQAHSGEPLGNRQTEAVTDTATLDARTASALQTADQHTDKFADTLTGIDRAIDISSENLRHVDTTAYKAICTRCDGGKTPVCVLDMEEGSIVNTNRPLDVAIQGTGFFKIKTNDPLTDGYGYTRNGAFFINDKGELILGVGDGYRLTPPITIPAGISDDEMTISTDGIVSVTKPGMVQKTVVGQLKLTCFPDAANLKPVGNGIYVSTKTSGKGFDDAPGENGAGQTVENYLEQSNVDIHGEQLRMTYLKNWRNAIQRAADSAAGDVTASARAE